MKLLAISGSTRANSSNGAILKAFANLCPAHVEVQFYAGIDQLPHFNPDLDKAPFPAAVVEFREQIQAADGIIICTPEYVFSLPGSLKNSLEWNVSTTLFSGKPMAFIVASASGKKAFESLDLVLTTIEAKMADSSKLLIQGAKGKVDADGNITDPKTFQEIEALVESLITSINN